MKVLILETCFEPGGKRTPDIFQKGEVKELGDEIAQLLIDKGAAGEYKEPKPEKPDAGDTPNEKWTVANLTKYAQEKGIDLRDATLKPDILAAVLAAIEPA